MNMSPLLQQPPSRPELLQSRGLHAEHPSADGSRACEARSLVARSIPLSLGAPCAQTREYDARPSYAPFALRPQRGIPGLKLRKPLHMVAPTQARVHRR